MRKEIGKVGWIFGNKSSYSQRLHDCTFLGATSSRRRISLPCLRVQFVYDAVQEAVKYTNIARHSQIASSLPTSENFGCGFQKFRFETFEVKSGLGRDFQNSNFKVNFSARRYLFNAKRESDSWWRLLPFRNVFLSLHYRIFIIIVPARELEEIKRNAAQLDNIYAIMFVYHKRFDKSARGKSDISVYRLI